MKPSTLDLNKIQITLYVREMFKFFPTIVAVDLKIINYPIKNLVTGMYTNHYSIYMCPYLDLDKYEEQAGVAKDSSISYIYDLYTNEQLSENGFLVQKRILDWGSFDSIETLQDSGHSVVIEDIDFRKYNYKNFNKKFLDFQILKNASFVAQLYQSKTTHSSIASKETFSHRFINADTLSFFNFLGQDASSWLENQTITSQVPSVTKSGFSLEKFKI